MAEIRVEVRVHGLGGRARALIEALRPDDTTAPKWLKISEKIVDDDLVVVVEAPAARLGSVRNTVDEILEYLYAALKAVEVLEKKHGKD